MEDPTQELIDAVPEPWRPRYHQIVKHTDQFCKEHLDEGYQFLARLLATAMCREGSPADRGKPESWAAGILYTLGQLNFLGDASFEPYMRLSDIGEHLGVSSATAASKAKVIREYLDLLPMDPRFTHPDLMDENPMIWVVEMGGLPIDLRQAPREVQVEACEQGLIPYVYADMHEEGEDEGRDEPQGGQAPPDRPDVIGRIGFGEDESRCR